MQNLRTTVPGTLLLVLLLAGGAALVGSVGRAGAAEDAIRRSDVDRIVKALEAQAKASADVAREIREASRSCK